MRMTWDRIYSGSNMALFRTIFMFVKNARRLTKSRGRQWETTLVKNFPRKITIERILSIVISKARYQVRLKKKKKIQENLA